MISMVSSLLLLFSFFLIAETTTTTENSAQITSPSSEVLNEEFPPVVPQFSQNYESHTNKNWRNLSLSSQAEHIYKNFLSILKVHGLSDLFEPSTLTCMTMVEAIRQKEGRFDFDHHKFEPQMGSDATTSSGINNLPRTVIIDLFKRGTFQSKVAGFSDIHEGRQFHQKMAGSLMAQQEIMVGVLKQKRNDVKQSDVEPGIGKVISSYYGHPKRVCRSEYTDSVSECSSCIKRAGVKLQCLKKAQLSQAFYNSKKCT